MIGRGAGCGKAACPVLRGAGYNSGHGRDHVAPPGNQAANREHKLRPTARGVPRLLEAPMPTLLYGVG